MKLACPKCKSSLDIARIKQHCFDVHNYTEILWQRFLRRYQSQSLVDLLENRSSTKKRLDKDAPGPLVSKPRLNRKSPIASRKNFFAKPLSKRARRRLARELGSMGISKQTV